MKNQSLRGKLEESIICVGAIERAGKCQGLRSVGGAGANCKAFCPSLMSWILFMGWSVRPRVVLVKNVVDWRNLCKSRMMSGPHMHA